MLLVDFDIYFMYPSARDFLKILLLKFSPTSSRTSNDPCNDLSEDFCKDLCTIKLLKSKLNGRHLRSSKFSPGCVWSVTFSKCFDSCFVQGMEQSGNRKTIWQGLWQLCWTVQSSCITVSRGLHVSYWSLPRQGNGSESYGVKVRDIALAILSLNWIRQYDFTSAYHM